LPVIVPNKLAKYGQMCPYRWMMMPEVFG